MIRNIISAFFTRGFVAACNLAVLLITTRELGSVTFGIVSMLIVNITIIQTLLDIYTGPALVHFIPGRDLRLIYRTGLMWILAGVLILNAVFYLFEVSAAWLWLHLLLLSFLATLHAFHNILILAKEKIASYNLMVFLQPAILIITLSLNVFAFEILDVRSNIIAMYCSWGVSVLVSSFIVARLLSGSGRGLEEAAIFKILRNGLINQVGNLAHILSNRYNYYVLSAAAVVGVYASATSLIESAWIISASIAPLVLTHVANRGGVAGSGKLTFLLARIAFLVSLCFVIILVMVPAGFFTFLLGKDFEGTKSIMLLLSPGVLFISFSSILSHYFSGLGRQKVLLLANSSGLLVTLATSYIFIKNFGITGACYAASLSYITQSLVLTGIFMREKKIPFVALFRFGKDLELLK